MQCSVGVLLGDACHKLTFCRKTGFHKLDSFPTEDREVIMWRSGLTILNIDANICYHHEQLMNKRYNLSHKTCSDPFKIHKKDVKGVYYGAHILF